MDTTPLASLAIAALIVLVCCIGIMMLVHASELAERERRDASIDRAWDLLRAERRTAYLDQCSYDWNAEAQQEHPSGRRTVGYRDIDQKRMDAVHESRAQRRG